MIFEINPPTRRFTPATGSVHVVYVRRWAPTTNVNLIEFSVTFDFPETADGLYKQLTSTLFTDVYTILNEYDEKSENKSDCWKKYTALINMHYPKALVHLRQDNPRDLPEVGPVDWRKVAQDKHKKLYFVEKDEKSCITIKHVFGEEEVVMAKFSPSSTPIIDTTDEEQPGSTEKN